MDPTLQKYLSGHEAPETRLAVDLARREKGWRHVLVVPAHDESPDFIDGYGDACSAAEGHTLVIAVLNGHEDDAPDRRARDLECFAELTRGAERISVDGHVGMLRSESAFDLLVLDRVTHGRTLAAGEGVGTARRAGADLALGLHALGAIRRNWIHNTDADVRLPRDYFETLPTEPKIVASLAPFEHVEVPGEDALNLATLRYELRLRWYVSGLRHAGSSRAHHSIGSTISVRPRAYAAVRGFPRRTAGEDFYLLDKLVNVGRIETRRMSPLQIRARHSDRVPFGTGPAVAELEGAREFRVYDPTIFERLARLHAALAVVVRGGDIDELHRALDGLPHLALVLRARGWLEAIEAIVRRGPPAQLRRRLVEYLDGLKTLQLVHALRDERWPDLPLDEAWRDAEFLGARRREQVGVEAMLRYLRAREGHARSPFASAGR